LFWLTASASALPPHRFEPLADVLKKYAIAKIPEASEYPAIPAIALLSFQEFKQLPSGHQRILHRIIKIFTAKGKEYATLKIPCLASCRVDGRTIKADGKVIGLPSKDIIRAEKFTDYTAPYHYAQFALPQVEPGDIIEYVATVESPNPFFIDDFRFDDPYPALKGVLVLTHPDDYSYSYVRYAPPGVSAIQVTRSTFSELPTKYISTMFVVRNIPAYLDEPLSDHLPQTQPGVRIVIDGRFGTRVEGFQDWWKYGEFIGKRATITPIIGGPIKAFILEAAGKNTAPAVVVKAIYEAAQKKIQIVDRSLMLTGFEFEKAEQVLKKRKATPHDFALFLATCFKNLKWDADLILVNSYNQPEARKDAAFPLDLNLIFLNVKSPGGEFLLDCNKNGRITNLLPSEAINRFALGIPLSYDFQTVEVTPFVSTIPYREGNISRFEVDASPAENVWLIDFRWFLGGEFQSEFANTARQEDPAKLKKEVAEFLRSRIHVTEIRDIQYQFVAGGIELEGKASLPRLKASADLEMLQNYVWISGFDLRQYLLEGRKSPLRLPVVGEISSRYRFKLLPGMNASLPAPFESHCGPVSYSLSFQKQPQGMQVEEKLNFKDLFIKQAQFDQFGVFLDSYYTSHFWSVLFSKI
jgi:Domain of Unknown Function with PDB structure (DUF3857)